MRHCEDRSFLSYMLARTDLQRFNPSFRVAQNLNFESWYSVGNFVYSYFCRYNAVDFGEEIKIARNKVATVIRYIFTATCTIWILWTTKKKILPNLSPLYIYSSINQRFGEYIVSGKRSGILSIPYKLYNLHRSRNIYCICVAFEERKSRLLYNKYFENSIVYFILLGRTIKSLPAISFIESNETDNPITPANYAIILPRCNDLVSQVR